MGSRGLGRLRKAVQGRGVGRHKGVVELCRGTRAPFGTASERVTTLARMVGHCGGTMWRCARAQCGAVKRVQGGAALGAVWYYVGVQRGTVLGRNVETCPAAGGHSARLRRTQHRGVLGRNAEPHTGAARNRTGAQHVRAPGRCAERLMTGWVAGWGACEWGCGPGEWLRRVLAMVGREGARQGGRGGASVVRGGEGAGGGTKKPKQVRETRDALGTWRSPAARVETLVIWV